MFSSRSALAALPPTLLLAGDAELMLSDTTEFAARALEAGAQEVEARVYVAHLRFCLTITWTD